MTTSSSVEAIRGRLMTVARQYAGRIQSQPGVFGMLLYGSLSSGDPPELTQFSDVDIALILDRELPAHFAEHRLVDGVKVDVLLFHVNTMRELVAKQPERLYQGGWLLQYLIKSLLLGGPETILYDPTGEIARTKQRFNELTTYPAMALPDVRRWLERMEREYLTAAEQQWREGQFVEAINQAGSAFWTLGYSIQTLAATRKLEMAAHRLGIPQFYPPAAELRQMLTPPAASMEAYWQATHSLWSYTHRHLCEPIQAELTRAGVEAPARLELSGDYPLFWPGNRIHELGRVIAEVDLSFAWSRFEMDHGSLLDARQILWACDAEQTRRRCVGLLAALKDAGRDVSHLVTPFWDDAEFQRLAAVVDNAGQAMQLHEASSAEAERAIDLISELHKLVTDVLT